MEPLSSLQALEVFKPTERNRQKDFAVQEVQGLVTAARQEETMHNDQLNKQQQRLDQMRQMRRTLEALTCFIHRLEEPIIFNIFLLVCAETGLSLKNHCIPALMLAQVCTYWYKIAQNPRLYSTIHIFLIETPSWQAGERNGMRRFQQLLQLSQNSNLFLTISQENSSVDITPLQPFIARAYRWKSLTLQRSITLALVRYLAPILAGMANLTRLDILPRNYVLLLPTLDAGHSLDILPWGHIKHLTLTGAPSLFVDILGCAPLLHSAIFIPTELASPSTRRSRVSNVRELRIVLGAGSSLHASAVTVLNTLIAPYLISLSIVRVSSQIQLVKFRDWLTLTRPFAMQSLNLSSLFLDFKTLLDLFRQLHFLQFLKIQEPNMSDDKILARLCPPHMITERLMLALGANSFGPEHSHPLMPQLNSLDLVVNGESFPEEKFVEMVKIRTTAPYSLLHLSLSIRNRCLSKDTMERLCQYNLGFQLIDAADRRAFALQEPKINEDGDLDIGDVLSFCATTRNKANPDFQLS